MIDWRAVGGVLGALLFALGVALLAPAAVGLAHGEPSWWAFGVTAVACLGAGGAAWATLRPRDELRPREGFAIVALAWLVLSLVGALPFVLGGVLPAYTDAFFETMSGFTTTGASVLGGAHTPAIEDLPRGFLLWRSLTHWLGGMGIIVLTLAVLPLLGVGGMQLFRAETPGPQADKLTPRVADTAKRLWLVYVGFTAVEVVLLLPAMSAFDAVNHAFSTMATGGFSTRNGSVADYGSAYVDWVITAFMVIAGVNFALHYSLLRGRWRGVWKSEELRVYGIALLLATAITSLALWNEAAWAGPGRYDTLTEAVRFAAFQVAAIMTTTGFVTADYEAWPALGVGVLFALFFVGGMAGSTGGGVKVVRVVLILKNSFRELSQLLHPKAILPVRLDHRVVSEGVMRSVLSFIVLYVGLIGAGTLVMTALGLDLLSAFSASFSTVGNVGPAFGTLGPTEHYGHVPALGKWVLAMLMMVGRLELFTVLLLFTPGFWRR